MVINLLLLIVSYILVELLNTLAAVYYVFIYLGPSRSLSREIANMMTTAVRVTIRCIRRRAFFCKNPNRIHPSIPE